MQLTVEVNEVGTEAAAVTSVSFGPTAVLGLTLRFDRPFIFIVKDTDTGAVLFMGSVRNPAS